METIGIMCPDLILCALVYCESAYPLIFIIVLLYKAYSNHYLGPESTGGSPFIPDP